MSSSRRHCLVALVLGAAAACGGSGDQGDREATPPTNGADSFPDNEGATELDSTGSDDETRPNGTESSGDTEPDSTELNDSADTESASSDDIEPSGGVATLDSGSDAVDILLAQSYSTTEVGDGIGTGCSTEVSTEPAVLLKDIYFNDPPRLGAIVALCLFGFSPDAPVDVTTLTNSGDEFITRFVPTSGERSYLYPGSTCESEEYRCGPPRESRNRLFEASERPIYSDGAGALVTSDWWYVPDLADSLAAAGSFRIDAVQGVVSASTSVSVEPSTSPEGTAFWLEDASDPSALYVVVGFEADQRVPIGLYESRSNADTFCPGPFDLVEAIGTFVVPPSGVTVLRIPDDVLARAADGTYVLMPPALNLQSVPAILDGQRASSCTVDSELPVDQGGGTGEVATTSAPVETTPENVTTSTAPTSEPVNQADSDPLSFGDRVERLQTALVEFGYLEPTDVDGTFGQGTESAVIAFQQDYGLDISGVAGQGTHEALGLPFE